jgi:hypothetical protein
MSRARDNLRKEKLERRIEQAYADGSLTPDDVAYRKSIRNKIKSGKLPRWTLVKGVDPKKTHASGLPNSKVKKYVYNENSKDWEPIYGGVAIIQMSTLDLFCKKIPQLKE